MSLIQRSDERPDLDYEDGDAHIKLTEAVPRGEIYPVRTEVCANADTGT
jgi:hypothetical protein